MGFWFHSTLTIIFFISFIIYFNYHYNEIIQYNTISSYSSNNIIGQIFLLIITILLTISLEMYWWLYLSFVYQLRKSVPNLDYSNTDIFFMLLFSSLSCIGLMLIGVFPSVSNQNVSYNKTLYDSHMIGVSMFVIFSFIVQIMDVLFIKRNIKGKIYSIGLHLYVFIYVFFSIIMFSIFVYFYFRYNINNVDKSINFTTIVLESFSLIVILLYPMFFCHFKHNIIGNVGVKRCCVLPEEPFIIVIE